MTNMVNVWIDVAEESLFYLESAARMRNVSRTQLMRRTLEVILKDQMFLSILDDQDRPSPKTASKRNKGRGGVGRGMPPRDRTFDALKPVPSVIQRKPLRGRRPEHQPTRQELEADLRQAVLNTGGVPTT